MDIDLDVIEVHCEEKLQGGGSVVPGAATPGAPAPEDDNEGAVNARIEVAIRVRPENSWELSQSKHRNIVEVQEDVIFLHPEEEAANHMAGTKRRKPHSYVFDKVYGPAATQLDIFHGTVKGLLPPLFAGYNSSVFCYGATGAGKTYTMMGDEQSMPGMIPMAVAEVFQMAAAHRENEDVTLQLSYSEVYNETIRDLLAEEQKPLEFREGEKGGQVAGLTWWEPVDGADVMRLVALGNLKRVKAETNVNEASSRSHAILQLLVQTKPKGAGVDTTSRVGKLSLIDLAGSERAAATENRGLRLKEGANINKSLLALGNVINALASKKTSFIGYRDSKLTRMLKDSLGGNCRTVMVTNISPSFLTYEDTHNALKYAHRAKCIQVTLKKNETTITAHVSRYKAIIENLQNQVAYLQEQVKTQRDTNKVLSEQSKMVTESECKQEEVSEDAKLLESEIKQVAERQFALTKKVAEQEGVRNDALLNLRKMHSEILRWKHTSMSKGGQEPVRIVTLQAEIIVLQGQVSSADNEIATAKSEFQAVSRLDADIKAKIPFLCDADQKYIERISFPLTARLEKLQSDSWLQYHKSREKYWEQRYHDLELSWEESNNSIDLIIKENPDQVCLEAVREQLDLGRKWKAVSDMVETSSVEDLLRDDIDTNMTPMRGTSAQPGGFTPTMLGLQVCSHDIEGSIKKPRQSIGLGINYLEKPRKLSALEKRSTSGESMSSANTVSERVAPEPEPQLREEPQVNARTPAARSAQTMTQTQPRPMPRRDLPTIELTATPAGNNAVSMNSSQNSRKLQPPRPRRANTITPGTQIPSYMKATMSSRSAFKRTDEEAVAAAVNTPRGGQRVQSQTPQQPVRRVQSDSLLNTPTGGSTPSFLKPTLSAVARTKREEAHTPMTSSTPEGERATLDERRRMRKLSQLAEAAAAGTPNPSYTPGVSHTPVPSFMQPAAVGDENASEAFSRCRKRAFQNTAPEEGNAKRGRLSDEFNNL
eukprot:TRINITY_DN4878_c0_g1_i1.p1 TRINITY_DN4878_c0_g1~~TRINITY_DN4878_c0_g1_i1.p1  ORF type:complete len:993 (+),score=295.70 TRINITY_DN4878_c0_g1_i1:46-3024(+)